MDGSGPDGNFSIVTDRNFKEAKAILQEGVGKKVKVGAPGQSRSLPTEVPTELCLAWLSSQSNAIIMEKQNTIYVDIYVYVYVYALDICTYVCMYVFECDISHTFYV